MSRRHLILCALFAFAIVEPATAAQYYRWWTGDMHLGSGFDPVADGDRRKLYPCFQAVAPASSGGSFKRFDSRLAKEDEEIYQAVGVTKQAHASADFLFGGADLSYRSSSVRSLKLGARSVVLTVFAEQVFPELTAGARLTDFGMSVLELYRLRGPDFVYETCGREIVMGVTRHHRAVVAFTLTASSKSEAEDKASRMKLLISGLVFEEELSTEKIEQWRSALQNVEVQIAFEVSGGPGTAVLAGIVPDDLQSVLDALKAYLSQFSEADSADYLYTTQSADAIFNQYLSRTLPSPEYGFDKKPGIATDLYDRYRDANSQIERIDKVLPDGADDRIASAWRKHLGNKADAEISQLDADRTAWSDYRDDLLKRGRACLLGDLASDVLPGVPCSTHGLVRPREVDLPVDEVPQPLIDDCRFAFNRILGQPLNRLKFRLLVANREQDEISITWHNQFRDNATRARPSFARSSHPLGLVPGATVLGTSPRGGTYIEFDTGQYGQHLPNLAPDGSNVLCRLISGLNWIRISDFTEERYDFTLGDIVPDLSNPDYCAGTPKDIEGDSCVFDPGLL